MTTSAPTSDPQVLADPHGLVATGEPLATLPELARMIGCSGRALHSLLSRRLNDRVRHVRYRPGATRYHVQDVLTAVEPLKPELEERRQRAEELEAKNRAAKAARLAAAEAAQSARKARQARQSSRRASQTAPKQAPSAEAVEPEVVIVRRPPSRSE
jgi:MarR-like DNA-binding transcriptional regulator SgrR of sgrS sRNA